MKAFSKEWWKKAAKQCTIEVYYHKTLGDKFEIPKYADLRDYCFNRYAEAYYKEKSWEDFTEEFDEVGKAQKIVGRLEERECILGIIEEEMNNKVLDYEKELNWIEDEYDSSTDDEDLIASEKKCAELNGQIKLSKLLIEKIKR